MKIISLWSGPRNVSTALMYSFAQRPDTQVVDEPLYAHYLSLTEVLHPGQQEVLDDMDDNGERVLSNLIHSSSDKDIRFLKNMAHHWVNLDDSFLHEMYHIFLIRNPKEMLPSLINQIENPVLRDTGLKKQVELYASISETQDVIPVIDSRQLLLDPGAVLKQACEQLSIPFHKEMLSWTAGPRQEDGVWAKHWYHNVHKSTGFGTYSPKDADIPEPLIPLYQECKPYYDQLYDKAIKVKP